MNLKEMGASIHATAVRKGFWDNEVIVIPEDPGEPRYAPARTVPNPSIFEEKIALIHEEVSEILDARRDADDAKEEEECADVIIRVLDYACRRGFDMDEAIAVKMLKNAARPYLHGRKR